MKANIKLQVSEEDLFDAVDSLSGETKDRLMEVFVWNDLMTVLENQLRGDTDFWSFNTSGYRGGAKLREAIAKFQGIEPEWKKDLESRSRSLEREVENYKRYYDWYFKLYHLDRESPNRCIDHAIKALGTPDKPKEV